jgi:hypothetical protein
MKRLSIICGIALLLSLMAVPAFPLSYELDFNGDGVWDTEWQLAEGETVPVEIWVDDYLEETLFAALLYFQYDPNKIRINEANTYPNDSDHGGPFTPGLSYIKQSADDVNVYKMSVAKFSSVTISDNKILLFTIELECIIDEADVAIEASNDLGFGGYNDGFVADDNVVKGYPDDAIADYDDDGDGVGDFFSDNCPGHYNPGQEDEDGDGVGDACESATTSSSAATSSTTTSILSTTSSVSSSSTTTSVINPAECASDIECDDEMFCNGAETCIDGACRPGTDPCPAGTECIEETFECKEKPLPKVLLEPDLLLQSRWIPLPVFLGIEGSAIQFDSSSSVTFSPDNSILALPPLVVDEANIFTIGLLMPLWLSGPLAGSIDVIVTTNSEEASKTINVELLPLILDRKKNPI